MNTVDNISTLLFLAPVSWWDFHAVADSKEASWLRWNEICYYPVY
jgi:hypothetical protein